MATETQVQGFQVGEGATVCFWSDRCAGTIIAVSASGKVVTWQADKATRADSNGMSDAQSYTYERDENGRTRTFSLRNNGRYVQTGESAKNGTGLVHGRREYYDYSF